MNKAGEFLLVNLFLLAIVLIGAGLIAAAWSIVSAFNLSGDALRIATIAAGFAAIFATYRASKALHALIQRNI